MPVFLVQQHACATACAQIMFAGLFDFADLVDQIMVEDVVELLRYAACVSKHVHACTH